MEPEKTNLRETNSKFTPETLGVGSDEFPGIVFRPGRCDVLVLGSVLHGKGTSTEANLRI